MSDREPDSGSPLEQLGILAMQSVLIDDDLEHFEMYTTGGLLTLLWHGPTDAENAVVCVGGAMGGLLGPDGGVYNQLGRLLTKQGIGLARVGYRKPNDLSRCVHDTLAAMEFMARHGTKKFITIGHSFGGAVAVQAAAHLDRETVPGVVTLATQSAGCEPVETMSDRSLLFIHGTADQILPPQASEMVRFLAEAGELVLLDGADHLLAPAGAEIVTRLVEHCPRVFEQARS